MKNTPFIEFHTQLGAKIVPFAGYNMPISYSTITDEHICVREHVGVFDVSHMGEFIVSGENAFALIQNISSNDASKLYNGKVQYSCLLNANGTIIDDMLVYKLEDNVFMIVVNASNIEKDWNFIAQKAQQYTHNSVEIKNISEQTALLAVQGPKAIEVLQPLCNTINLSEMPYYTFQKDFFAGIPNVLVSATGYTGSGGFEIYCHQQYAHKLWNAVFEAGKNNHIQPIGLGARDTLRLEMGFCLYGNDIDDTTTPLNANLGWITDLKKDFEAKNALLEQKKQGINKKLVGFELTEKGIPRQHCPVTTPNGEVIGMVTSGTYAPYLKKSIGMAYISTDYAKENTQICIDIRNKLTQAKIVKTPFYKPN